MKKKVKKQSSKSFELDEKKTKYFVIAIVLLILLSILLIVHFNNKSLVSGEDEVKTTKTTTTIKTTTKKVKKQQVKKEEVKEETKEETPIYKSVIDADNKLVYNYQLTDEISETDVLVSKVLEIDEKLKEQNVVSLFDISLYDSNLVKKSVSNSKIDVSIPLSKELLSFDELKVVYIDDKGVITDELFESKVEEGYIKFSTTHLSVFGIIGIKKEVLDDTIKEEVKEETEEPVVDLSKVTVDVKVNDIVKEDYSNVLVQTSDKIDVVVNGLDGVDYTLSYLLRDEEGLNDYKEFDSNMFKAITAPSKYTLIIKVSVGEVEETFEIGVFNVYDIVFVYDKEASVEEDVVYGEIETEDGTKYTNEDGSEYLYDDMNINKDIVIDNKEVKEDVVLPEEDIEINEENKDESLGDITIPSEEEQIPEEDLADKATISLKGNVYLVEKTDITDLEITGYLVIDTVEDVVYNNEQLSNIYSIIIKSKEFSLNGKRYTYEFTNEGIVITRLDVLDGEEESDIFEGYEYDSTKEELIFTKKEEVLPEEGKDEISEEEILEQPSTNEEQAPDISTN